MPHGLLSGLGIKHESVFISVSCGSNEAHSQAPPGARNDEGLHCKLKVLFYTRSGSVQSKILSHKMERFHFCT